MPPPPKPTLPKAAEPKHGRNFDPWNSVALGHQRAETRGPQGWRENRTWKLQNQLQAGHSGGPRLSDRVGAGSEDYDEQLGVLIPKEVRARAANSVVDMLRKPGTMNQGSSSSSSSRGVKDGDTSMTAGEKPPTSPRHQDVVPMGQPPMEHEASAKTEGPSSSSRKIFDGLCIYVNGSTHPHISDHKLRHLLAQNGARMSIHLGRRQVTHVILGKPSGPNTGAGGGLAGGKLEKEIRRVGGCGVKYVGVEWVLESVKAGRRLPEARFANLKVAPRKQPSVYGAFSKAAP
ncbi:hypothetical protein KVR01_011739 [Diaporthe batatas]|uniref:uncharacterized protein n=1 Tax=Diaporthe batatas TaxID=748121 RepID=UPI001D04C801|nr:uncharacterized protein KVR01_011739 [Diaporthe batatas]KAG8158617.1 hypothetical protein KVR01_011739 [Diaporthe batatas]